MFQNDIKEINDFAQSNAVNLFKVAFFVRATIRNHFNSIKDFLIDFSEKGNNSSIMRNYTTKRFLSYFKYNQEKIYNETISIIETYRDNPDEMAIKLIILYSKIPGIGIVKAGFLTVLVAGVGGCLDYLNALTYNIPKAHRKFRARGTDKALENTARKYVAVCHDIGTECLWDSWCTLIFETYRTWATPEEVSKYHFDCIKACNSSVFMV